LREIYVPHERVDHEETEVHEQAEEMDVQVQRRPSRRDQSSPTLHGEEQTRKYCGAEDEELIKIGLFKAWEGEVRPQIDNERVHHRQENRFHHHLLITPRYQYVIHHMTQVVDACLSRQLQRDGVI